MFSKLAIFSSLLSYTRASRFSVVSFRDTYLIRLFNTPILPWTKELNARYIVPDTTRTHLTALERREYYDMTPGYPRCATCPVVSPSSTDWTTEERIREYIPTGIYAHFDDRSLVTDSHPAVFEKSAAEATCESCVNEYDRSIYNNITIVTNNVVTCKIF